MARFEGGTVVFETTWTAVKDQIDTRKLDFRFEEDATAYEIFAVDENFLYRTVIYKAGQAPQDQATFDTWRADFEANYKNRVVDFNNTEPVFISNIDGYSVVLKDGASPTANDGYGIALIGYDGSNYRMTRMDSSGHQILVGAGIAGTPSGGVISIQGVSGGQAMPISGSVSVTGSVTTTNASVGLNNAAIPTSSTQVGGSDGTNLQVARIFDLDTGGGTQYVLGVGLRKASGGGSVELGTLSDPIRIDPTGTTPQPATQSGTWTVQPGDGNIISWLITISQGGNAATVTASNALKVDGSAVTQPISGTVTANIGTTNGLALDTTLARLTITQGTALGANTQALMGGSVTTAAPTYTTGNINPLSLTTAGALRIDGSATTQPVSGTVTANAGTGNFTVVQATASNLRAQTSSESNTGSAIPTQASMVGGSDGANLRAIFLDSSGRQIMIGASANGAAVAGNPVLIAGSDGTNARSIRTATDGTVRVDPTGTTTQPVSGTVSAAQSGTWTVQPGNTANTTPWLATISQGGNVATVSASNALKVDGSAVTQPVSGTVTANIGTSGSLALDTSVNGILRAQGSTTSGQTGPLILGAVTTAAPSYTTGQSSPLSLDTTGALRITGSISASNPSVGSNNAAIPTSSTQIGGSDGTNLQAARIFDLDTGGGTQYILGVGLRKAASGGTVEAGTSTDPIRVDPTGTTPQPVSGTVAATQSGTWTVQPGNTANTTPWLATVSQGGNNAGVKAAGIPADGSEPALVVAVSPTTSVIVSEPDILGSGTLNALNATAALVTSGRESVGMFLAAGTLVGTIVPEISINGSTWVQTFFDDPSTGNKVSSIVFGVANTATTRSIVGAGGSAQIRVRVSAFTGGTAACSLRATNIGDPTVLFTGSNGSTVLPPTSGLMAGSDGSTLRNIITDTTGRQIIVGAAADGAALSGNPVLSGGSDGTNAQTMLTDTTGRQVMVGAAADGAAVTGNPVLIGGSDGTNAQSILTDTIGRIITAPTFMATTTLVGGAFGQVSLAVNTLNAVRATAYTEQASNAQRSMASSSANDTSAGTGARSVRITYYTATYTGPFTTTVTMNGTANVNTSVSDICFIERMEVLTVGSGNTNAGTITLFAATAGGGGAIGTIAIGDGITYWSHHYIATGKTCFVTNMMGANNGNQGVQFALRYRASGANQAEIPKDWVRIAVSSIGGVTQRFYDPPLEFAGGGRIVGYVKPDQAVTAIYNSSFDFYEE